MPSSSYEILTRRFLLDVFSGIQWEERERPDFLRYITGNNLELDLWAKAHHLAVEVQGPQHYRSVKGMSTAEQSRAQRDRDTFKRQRCVEEGIKLVELNIFTLCLGDRFYYCYLDLARYLGVQPLTRFDFDRRLETQEIIAQASSLATQCRPVRKRRRYRKPGLWQLLQRMIARN